MKKPKFKAIFTVSLINLIGMAGPPTALAALAPPIPS